MTPEQLEILLQEGEGTMLEYKESLSDSFARELAALSNTLGGRILLGVRKQGCPEPTFETNGFFTAIFQPNPHVRVGKSDLAHDEAHDEAHEPMSEIELKIMGACAQDPKSTPELLNMLGYKARTGNFKKALSFLIERGFLKMTNPEKPRAKNQRYRITDRGVEVLQRF